MAHQWRGVIREYADRLPMLEGAPVVTLHEGGTPLIHAEKLSERVGAEVHLKYEGLNPTGSFKDRGMTTAISVAASKGAKAVICASTGNTSASAAAYATKAGMTCGVLVPDGKIAMGKLSQAIAHGATLLQVDGNFDDCLTLARKLAEAYPVELVNSVNPARIEGQKTAALRGRRRARRRSGHPLPPGRQRRQHHGVLAGLPRVLRRARRRATGPGRPRTCRGCGASRPPAPRRSSSATRSTTPRRSRPPSASATRRRGSRPSPPATSPAAASRPSPTSRSSTRTATSPSQEGVFVEPGSAASVAGLLASHAAGPRAVRGAHRLHRHRPRTQGPPVGAAHRRRERGRADPGLRRRLLGGPGARPRGLTA